MMDKPTDGPMDKQRHPLLEMRYTLRHGGGGITRCYRFEVTRIFFVVHGIFIRGFVRLNMSLSFIQNDFFRKAEVVHGDVLFR